MTNSMYVIYYIKQVPPVAEVDVPYQGKIIKAIGSIPGYEPDQTDIQEFAPVEDVDVALGIQICLN